MISRTYTVDDGDGNELRCYKGFNLNFVNAPVIAVVLWNGEAEFFALDEGEEAREQFLRYIVTEGEKYDVKFYHRR